MTAAEVQRLTFDTASCAFRLTAPCVGSRRASAAPGGYRPSGPQKPGEAIADAFVAKLSIGPRSPLGALDAGRAAELPVVPGDDAGRREAQDDALRGLRAEVLA